MQEQTELNKEIGTLDPEKKEVLSPKKVKIVNVKIRETNKGKILECEVKHPDKEEPIHISSLSYIRDREVVSGGLWITLDKEGKIQKGSALAVFMGKYGAKNPAELSGKEIETELDEKEWLCFKAY